MLSLRQYGFCKEERLSSKKDIDFLLSKGHYFRTSHFRVCYLKRQLPEEETEAETRILISVPKRQFKRAVKRNRIKRLVRESYRLQKQGIKNLGLDIQFVYSDTELPDFQLVYSEVGSALESICKRLP